VVLHPEARVASNTTGVIVDLIAVNTASDWAALEDFLHHVVLTCYSAILVNLVDSVLGWHSASLAWAAVSANFHGRALLTIRVSSGLVNGTSLIGDFILTHPSESSKRVTAVTSQ